MEIQPVASSKPDTDDDDATGIIVLGVLIPIAIIIFLLLMYHIFKQRNDKSQPTPYQPKVTPNWNSGESGTCFITP